MSNDPTEASDDTPDLDAPRDPDDIEQTDDSTPAFDIDLDPGDQGLAGSGAEPSG